MLKGISKKLCIFVTAGFMICNIGVQTSFAQLEGSGKMPDKGWQKVEYENHDKKNQERYKKGELLVKYKSTYNTSNVNDTIKKASKSKTLVPEIKEKLSNNIEVIKVGEDEDIDAMAKELSKDPNVEYAQPNYIYQASYIPQDARFSEQWSFKTATGVDINATRAWDITKGSSSVVVGVIDTGIAFKHPDLENNIYINPNETVDNQDNDGNTYVDDIRGWDFVENNASIFHTNENTHGTHVAGTIAAIGNTSGVIGVAPNVKIMPLRVLNEDGKGKTSDIVKAIDYAAGKGVTILNLSLSGTDPEDNDPVLLNKMSSNPQILFVVAAGNDCSNLTTHPSYPASFDLPNMLVVSSIDSDGSLSYFSNYGPQVDIAAPGSSILSTIEGKDASGNIIFEYDYLGGTSMAAPHVAGAAALIKSQYPNASIADIINRIKNAASVDDDIKADVSGGRVLDAYNSLNNLGYINFTNSRVTENSIDVQWEPVSSAVSYKCQLGYGGYLTTGTTSISVGSLKQNTSYVFRILAVNSSGQTIAEKRFIKKTLAVGTGTGLKANYFNDANMNDLKISRCENIGFNWGSGSPDPSINNQSFSGLWNGELEARYTEGYTLFVQTSGAVKVWVDGTKIIDRTMDNSSTMVELSGNLNLQEGKHYPIQIEYYETTGDAGIKLLWSSVSQKKEVVPASRLYQTSIYQGIWTKSAKSDNTSSLNVSHSMVEGGKLYVVSNDMVGRTAQLEVYDSVQNKFVLLKELTAKLPDGTIAGSDYYQASTSLNGKIYLFNHRIFTNDTCTTVQEYDIATGTLTDKNSQLGTDMHGYDSAITLNGQIYVFGGSVRGPNLDIKIYNPTSNSWTTVAQMPDARYGYSLTQLDGKVYMFGGLLGSDTVLRSVYVFDPQNNLWTKKKDMQNTLWGQGSVAVNGKIMVYGGYTDLSNYTKEGNIYDPQNDTWSPAVNLLSVRGFQAMEYYNGRVFSIYGNSKMAYNYFDVLEKRYAVSYKISGYIKPDLTSSNSQIKAGFNVEVEELEKSAVTDQNGYFEITGVPSNVDGYTLKVTKNQYLMRKINNVKVKVSNVQIGTTAAPVDMWAGDIDKNNAINMTDLNLIGNNKYPKYDATCDLNQDGVVDTQDIGIAYVHFNTSTSSYPSIF